VIFITQDISQHSKTITSRIKPIANTSNVRLNWTPASIMAKQPPHTDAMDEEPLDSVISETTRMLYAKSSALGNTGIKARLAKRPWPISRRFGLPTRPVRQLQTEACCSGTWSDRGIHLQAHQWFAHLVLYLKLHYESLCFTTGKQCWTVCTWQYAITNFNWTNSACITASIRGSPFKSDYEQFSLRFQTRCH